MTGKDRATQAAIASGWVDEEAPDIVLPRLLSVVQHWRDGPAQPISALWLSLLDQLLTCGCYDAALSCSRLALSLFPRQAILRIRQAQILYRVGEDKEAFELLDSVAPLDPCRAEALAIALTFGRTAPMEELERLLLEEGEWAVSHSQLIDGLVRNGLAERAAAFLNTWMGRWQLNTANLGSLASAALRAGQYRQARDLFMPLLTGLARQGDSVLGQFDGSVSAYDATVEARILHEIEVAFARPEDQLAAMPMWSDAAPRAGLKVMFLSFGDRDLPNDIAWHMAQSAQLTGVELKLYLDSAVMLSCDFRGHDEEVKARIAKLVNTLRQDRPDVVIMDNCHPITYRGLAPARSGRAGCRFYM